MMCDASFHSAEAADEAGIPQLFIAFRGKSIIISASADCFFHGSDCSHASLTRFPVPSRLASVPTMKDMKKES